MNQLQDLEALSKYKLELVKTTDDISVLFARYHPTRWEDFEQAPKQIVVNGVPFMLRSFTADGLNYITPHTANFVATQGVSELVAKWTRQVFTTATPITAAERAREELVEELLPELQKFTMTRPELDAAGYQNQSFGDIKSQIASEIADVAICLIDVCALLGINFELAVYEKLKINEAREWGEPDENNQRRHIK
jgi:NTP pyrophosphatase (non-canonical NTP hydrolase)